MLTSTPNKDELEQSIINRPSTSGSQIQAAKRNILGSKNPILKKRRISSSSESSWGFSDQNNGNSSSEDDADCLYCKKKLWSRSTGEGQWVKCLRCSRWAHAKCAGNPKKTFNCMTCRGLKDVQ